MKSCSATFICSLILLTFLPFRAMAQFTEQTGIILPGVSSCSVAWGDYNNNGNLDLLIAGNGMAKVFKNNGNNTFAEQTGISLPGVSNSSCAWGDYNNDGYLDILLTGQYYNNGWFNTSKVYKNNGDNTFTEQTSIILAQVANGSVAWGDYDNDGYLDILLSGQDQDNNAVTKIFRNNRDNTFIEQSAITLMGVNYGSVTWGDYNNDGYSDILITGNWSTKIYRNNGDNTFTDLVLSNLQGVYSSSAAWGDYNNDGFLDLIVAGANSARVYKNNGDNTFTEQTGISLTGITSGSVAWGDYNNDGYADILLTGYNSSLGNIAKIYKNNGNNTYTEQTSISLAGVQNSSVAWGDYNNDGTLDIVLAGYTGTTNVTKIYLNGNTQKNTAPAAPTGLISNINGNIASLKWNAVRTDVTPYKAMSGNLRVGKTPGGQEIISPQSASNGLRRVAAIGNTQLDTTYLLKGLKKGTYYWSVQAIDNGFAGGTFAAENSFTVTADVQASNIQKLKGSGTSITLQWTRGTGQNCVVFAKMGNTGTASPLNNTTYIGNPILGQGTQIGTSGWYCVYNGSGDTITVKNLTPLTDYNIQIFEYSGTAGNEIYINTVAANNPVVKKTGLFAEFSGISLPGFSWGGVSLGDYNNDGYLDLLVAGNGMTKVYRNNGNNTFTEQTSISLQGVSNSSVAWGDYNNDGYLDILLTGNYYNNGTVKIAKVYKNNGDNTFTDQTGIKLTGVDQGSATWGDYNNDGYPDILLTGYDIGNSVVSKIFRNEGNNNFVEQTNISLPSVSNGSATWGDYDNDGKLDILLAGSGLTRIYHNNGDNTFTEQKNINLPGVWYGTAVWGDYSNDGDLDILITGNGFTKVYLNNGSNNFIEQTGISITGLSYVSAAWGDINNDGNLDIVIAGFDNVSNIVVTKIYFNNGDNTFTEQGGIVLPGIEYGSVALADYNNDGALDLVIMGYTGSSSIAKIFRNEIFKKNVPPVAPAGLGSQVNGNNVKLIWKPVKTDVTPYKSMSYNIRVGTASNGFQIASPQSAPGGFHRIAALGNGQLDTSFVLNNLKKGTYYWSVQAVDNGYSGGPFAGENSFPINSDAQASNIQLMKATGSSMLLQWVRGTGQNCIVFVKAGNTGTASPANNTTYTANTSFGLGSQLGTSGWYCIYKGMADTITVKNLSPLTDYSIQVFEYSGSLGAESYLTLAGAGNPVIKQTVLFSEVTGLPFQSLYNGTITWGDYDNDGDLDILLTGWGIARIYRNDGNNVFTEQTGISLQGVNNSAAAWGDYNNDGYLDILLTGGYWNNGWIRTTKVYKNNGNNTFSEQTSFNLSGVEYGSVAWGDYDNDGFLDILMSGNDNSGAKISKVYKNMGGTAFIEQTGIVLTGVANSSVAWGDYDGDGYLDILLTGISDNGNISKIYHNNGNNTFTEQTGIAITAVGNSSVAFGDYNSDGYLDILLTGSSANGNVSKIYRNNGNGSFTEQTGIVLTGVSGGSVAWGDYDNDGDLDILLTGYDNLYNPTSKIYRNNGDNTFAELTSVSLTGIGNSKVSWGDYDNDNDLDIIMIGNNGNTTVTKLYRNDITAKNTPPVAPGGLASVVNGGNIILKWNPVKTDATPYKGLTYNVRVGIITNGIDRLSPQSSISSGYRRIVAMGNSLLDTSFVFNIIKKGTYYWSVQAIDNDFTGGPFAIEKTFAVNANIQAYNVRLVMGTANSALLQWTRGNGTKCAVFAKQSNSGTASPANNTTYAANASFGLGTQIGSTGWYCVYNGTLDTTTVLNLTGDNQYLFQVIEFDGNPGFESYYTATGILNPFLIKTGLYLEKTGLGITGLQNSAVALGDYDNDGDLDILIAGNDNLGNTVTKLYKNNGNNTFNEQTSTGLMGVSSGALAWADYNNDGFLDILITGLNGSGTPVSKVYSNNGNGTFTEQTGIILPGLKNSSVAWGDYNNDGLLDILIAGQDINDSLVTGVYQNKGNNSFMQQLGIILPGVTAGTVTWGDYDRDNYLDILITGQTSTGMISKVFRNNGNNTFSEQINISLTGVGSSSAAWGDFNNDGFLDILLAGVDQYNNYTARVYRNNRDNTFNQMNSLNLPPLSNCDVAWGDYDNDGHPDILLSGLSNSKPISKIYHNTADTAFTEQTNISLKGVYNGFSVFGDLDMDGDLDILLSGNNGSVPITSLYVNQIKKKNYAPAAPIGQGSSAKGNQTILTWNSVRTDETPFTGLSYNVRIGRIPGISNVVTAQSAGSGQRKLVSNGNGQMDSTFMIKNLQRGPYYWSVQAIDNGYSGGIFSTEQQFLVSTFSQASNIQFLTSSSTSMLIQWTRGNGTKCAVFARQGNSGTASPEVNTTYAANSFFGNGSQIGTTGWYCIYNGDKDTVTVNNLQPATEYIFQVFEYEGSAGVEYYFTVTGDGNPAVKKANLYFEQPGTGLPLTGRTGTWGDYNNDGKLDILLASYPNSRIFLNNGNNTFTEQTGISLLGVNNGNACWADYNNDGYLDVLIFGQFAGAGKYATKLYKNNGDNTFTEQTGIVFDGVRLGAAAWGDYNNDGYQDLLLTGNNVSNVPVTKLYRNNGDNTFTEQTQISLISVYYSSVAWGDYNNDGYLDILLTGNAISGGISRVYRNNGDNTFTEQSQIILPGVRFSAAAWGDYDNDGYMDILLSGYYTLGGKPITRLYRNDHDNHFIEQTGIALPGLYYGTVACGDYDNNGTLDIMLTGQTSDGSYITRIYKNNGNNSFAEQTSIFLPGVFRGSASWGDYDNDGDLDLLLTGYNVTSGYITKLFRNDIPIKNPVPPPPAGLTALISGNNAILSWKPVQKKINPGVPMNYNVRVAKTHGGMEITSPQSDTSGFRRVVAMGNGQLDTSYILKLLKKGTYYWSVQAVDNEYAGSNFAPEQNFIISTDAQASHIQFSVITAHSFILNWIRGTGSKCAVFVLQGNTGTASPVNNTTYLANASFGKGSQIGSSGWYCVYNGNKDTVTVSNLNPLVNYIVQVFEYDGAPGGENLYSGSGTINPAWIKTSEFAEQTGIQLDGVTYSSVTWGDYNNDGYLDILLTGQNSSSKPITKLYQNNRNNTFSEQTGIALPGVLQSSVAWGDYDNDGNLDILLTGSNSSGIPIAKLYRNNGDNTFTEQTNIILTGVYLGSVAWGDYNNDGKPDILLTGYNGYNAVTKLYRNNRDNTFTEITGTSLPDVYGSSAVWGDFNNDGMLDVFLSGYSNSGAISKIFLNNGDNTFSELISTLLTGVYYGQSAVCDYDNDGWLDILITGYDINRIPQTRLYHNNRDNTFTEQTQAILTGVSNSSVMWGDFDKDGKPDLLLTGKNFDGVPVSKVYHNDGDGLFTEESPGSIIGAYRSCAVWGDYNNDGALDILLSGFSANARVAKVYRNESGVKNNAPFAPDGLANIVNGNSVTLKWNSVATDETPARGMTYNIRVGLSSGGSEIVSPISSPAGFHRIVAMGNTQLDTFQTLNNLRKDTCYWSVQAVDNGYASSLWSQEQAFIITSDFQASDIRELKAFASSLSLQWVRGSSDACIVFMKKGNSGYANPVSNKTYSANSFFGQGSQIGTSGWFCVYKGNASAFTIENLEPATNYMVQVIEFSGAPASENYFTLAGTKNPAMVKSGEFTEVTGPFMGLMYGQVSWVDYNNDGNLDLFVSGIDTSNVTGQSILYRNNSDHTFTTQNNIVFDGVSYSAQAWGDYNNDGNIDLLLTGDDNTTGYVTKIYRNNGDNTFAEQTSIILPGVGDNYANQMGVAWGDYNNDGLLDILLTGYSNSGPISKIFRNDGNNNFLEQTGIVLPPVYSGSVAWGDYNNDGDLDLLLSGMNASGSLVTKLYRNNGDNSFTEMTGLALTPVAYSCVAWGDYDNDGYLDILLAGYDGTGDITKVFRNDGNGNFIEQTGIVLPGVEGTATWGDYDNDGNLDILLVGDGFSRLYRNNGDNTFTEQLTISLPAVGNSSAAFADFDNDGDLDIVISGSSGSGLITRLFRNDRLNKNMAPAAPQNLSSDIYGNQVTLKWKPVSSDQTSSKSMTYNVRVGKVPGSSKIVSSQSASSGFRKIVGMGNGQLDTTFRLVIPRGAYYWSVQAVDNGFAGGAFSTEQSFTVTKFTPVINWNNPENISYGVALTSAQLNAFPNVPGSLVYYPSAGTVLNGGMNQALSVTFNPQDTANYVSVTKTVNINVLKIDQSIAFGALSLKTYGNADFSPGATATSGLTVTYSSSNQNVATIVNAKIHITGAGSVDIKASQGGDLKYNAAPDVVQNLIVSKGDQQITFASMPVMSYGSPDFSPATASSGLAITYSSSNENVAIIINGKIHIVGIGTDSINASQPGSSAYNPALNVTQMLTVNKAGQVITFAAISTKNYGDPDFFPGAVTTSGLPILFSISDSSIITILNGKVHITGTGTVQIAASQAGNANYNAATSVSQLVKVNKTNQYISFSTMQPRTYGDADFDPGAVTSSGLPVIYSISNPVVATIVNGKIHILNAWITEITAMQPGDQNYNAAISATQTLIINKANQAITFPPISFRQIGASDFDPGATASSGLPVSYFSSDPTVAIIVNGKIRVLSRGTTDITATQSGNGNYNAAADMVQSLMVVATDVADLSELGIRMYPNPAKEKFYIEGKGNLRTIELIDLLGKSILLVNVIREKTEMDVSALPSGIYFVRLTGKDFRREVKLMINK